MKRTIQHILGVSLAMGILAFTQTASAQCNGGHSTDPTDAWISCTGEENPNEARTEQHWIMYDFANIYALNETVIWNYNVSGETDKGIKTIVIDTSTNGSTWNEWGTMTIDEAAGDESYEGEIGPDFNGIAVRYVLISVIENWGDADCNGFAEIKFNVGPGAVTVEEQEDPMIAFDVYPSPANTFVSINVDDYNGGRIEIISASGEVIRVSPIRSDRTTLDVQSLSEGIYFVRLTDADGLTAVQRFAVMR